MKSPQAELTRRRFLQLATAGTTLYASLPWQPSAIHAASALALDGTGLALPCAVGDVASDGALVWFRARGEHSLVIEYSKDPALKDARRTTPVKAQQNRDFTGQVLITGLESNTRYYYRAAVESQKPGPAGRFLSAPKRDEMANVKFAFSGDTRADFQPFTIMDAIRDKQPDLFFHLGDTIYADRGGRARTLSQFRSKYGQNRDDAPTQRLFSETSLVVVWDDHEVEDNYRAENPAASVGRQAFFEYWPVRRTPTEPDRIYRSLRWGKGAEFFVLDTRQYRSLAEKTMLRSAQKQWLLDSLAACDAVFKFICTSVPFTGGTDKWGDFADERDEILQFIAAKKITGVVFLSADVHYAAVSRVPGNLRLKEIITGPLAAPMGKGSGSAKRFDFFSAEYLNYGLVELHADAAAPYLEIQILSDKNSVLHKLTIRA